MVGRDSSVGIVTRYGPGGSGIKSKCGQDFPHPSGQALGPTQPPIKWVPSHSPGVKRPGPGVDHSPLLAPRLKKEQSYTSTPPLCLRGLFQGELYLYLYLYSGVCLEGFAATRFFVLLGKHPRQRVKIFGRFRVHRKNGARVSP